MAFLFWEIFYAKPVENLSEKNSKKVLTFQGACYIITKHSRELYIAEWSNPVARRAHNPEVAGSNPVSATSLKYSPKGGYFFYLKILQPTGSRGLEHDCRRWRMKGVRLRRSGQSFCAAPRHKETLGTARGPLQVQILSPQPV